MFFYVDFFGIFDLPLFILNIVFSILVINLERKDTSTALAWLFIMLILPGFGFFFYIMLSQNIAKRKIFKYTDEERNLYAHYLDRQAEAFEKGAFKFHDMAITPYKDHILFHNRLSESFFTQNNAIGLFYNGTDKFDALFHDIHHAKDHIHLLYYIIQYDTLGQQLLNLLQEKAASGVTVRLLIDSVGSRHIPKSKLKALKASGVYVAEFFPSRLRALNFQANYRNHRKLVIIDGEVGYLGGFNVGDEYLGRSKKFGPWRDTHMRITGDAVISLQIRFLLDWRLAANEMLPMQTSFFKEQPSQKGSGVQIVSSGPDSQHQQIKQGFLKMIHSAKTQICIQTPYFIPDESIIEALRIAAASGIKIRIMVPNLPDHPFVYWATLSYLADLLPYGIEAYTYTPGFLHAKVITVDGMISSLGTCNFDNRSFKLNFEVNAFIYDQVITTQLENQFHQDVSLAKPYTLADRGTRSVYARMRERLSRIFAPIL